jgi:CobW/HypB/UreG, nucleotide-binding domain
MIEDEETPHRRKPPAPFPLTIVTGFLGAGKTSLLNRLLRDPAAASALVIINEFGEIGLDHLLVERVDDDMLVMTSGLPVLLDPWRSHRDLGRYFAAAR